MPQEPRPGINRRLKRANQASANEAWMAQYLASDPRTQGQSILGQAMRTPGRFMHETASPGMSRKYPPHGVPLSQQRQAFPVSIDGIPQPTTPGNINLSQQPRLRLPNGKIATVYSRGLNIDGKEYLLPAVTPDGRLLIKPNGDLDDGLIMEEFYKTGRHLGIFRSPQDAAAFSRRLSSDYNTGKIPGHPSSEFR